MDELYNSINGAKHIEIRVDDIRYLSGADALYSYILTLHKKVSLYLPKELIDKKYSFLPWFSKIKTTDTPSSDYIVDFKLDALALYSFFEIYKIKLNKKMATSLYAMLLVETDGFKKDLDGTKFAVSSKLLEHNAESEVATFYLLEYSSLAQVRLKGEMLLKMQLQNNASVAEFFIDDAMLKSSGANIEMAQENIKEALSLVYVKKVILYYNNKIVKIIEKERYFGEKK